ncbi:MAG TPA: hypothetical protein PLQ76_04505 [bacterium]|nr:hypothetical protein [bacterium]
MAADAAITFTGSAPGIHQPDNELRAQWAEHTRKAAGLPDTRTFSGRLEALLRNDLDKAGFSRLPSEAAAALIRPADTVAPPSQDKTNSMSQLVSLGRLNEATYLNVAHITADRTMFGAALNAYDRNQKETEVEPVQSIDGQVGSNS